MKNNFEILLLIGRPASGKSEIIDFLKRVPTDVRRNNMHIGDFIEIDDFPMLWTWMEEDKILDNMGLARTHTNKENYFKHMYFWDVLIERICLEYSKFSRDNPNYEDENTIILEFSRGSQHGGYKRAFDHLDESVLPKLAIFFNNVSWEESLRKNRKRFNPDKPDSVLEHGLPDKKMEFLYKEIDWNEIANENSGYLDIKNIKVPFVVFDNENDITSADDETLHKHLKSTLSDLWELYKLR